MWMNNQHEIDDFPKNYPGCKIINGFLMISGDDITNLQGLSHIEAVSGGVELNSMPKLESLDGLSALKFINAGLTIKFNINLKSIDALGNIEAVYQDIYILNNDKLLLPETPSLLSFIDGV